MNTILPEDPRARLKILLILARSVVQAGGRDALGRGLDFVSRAEAILEAQSDGTLQTLPPSEAGETIPSLRVPRGDADCALCSSKIDKSYVRESQTRLLYCDTQCFAGHAIAIKNLARKVS